MSPVSCASRALVCLVLSPVLLLAASSRAADVSVTLDAGSGFSIKNNTGAIERLRVDEANGNVSRNGALFVHTTGNANLFVGPGAGNLTTSGDGNNTAFGSGALAANTTGYRNAAFGTGALGSNTTGYQNAAFGWAALSANTTGIFNSGFGYRALLSNTSGQRNSAFGNTALHNNTTGNLNSGFGERALYSNTSGVENSAFGARALLHNTTGTTNSAFGAYALRENTGGSGNAAFGRTALVFNTTGNDNSAFGMDALRSNTTSPRNSAFGREALLNNDAFFGNNSAFGFEALQNNTTGFFNSAFGVQALKYNTTGYNTIAIGKNAGDLQTTGSNNIYIGHRGVGAESGFIRIGTGGMHTRALIQGIHGVAIASGSQVFVNSTGLLGTTSISSARFKRDVRDMGDASEVLMKLRPVAFRYREGVVADGTDIQLYGLIAEEVAAVAPELVAPDAEGKPYAVQYHQLPALLLNELQKQQRTIAEQQRAHDEQQRTIEALVARVAELERRSPRELAVR